MHWTMSPASLFSSTPWDLRVSTMVAKVYFAAGFSLFFHVVNNSREAEHGVMVLLGYHIELSWHYVKDKSHHLPLVPGFTSYSKNSSSSRGCCNMVMSNKSTEYLYIHSNNIANWCILLSRSVFIESTHVDCVNKKFTCLIKMQTLLQCTHNWVVTVH